MKTHQINVPTTLKERDYLSEDQYLMYTYLFYNKGKEAAIQYYKDVLDSVNRAKGMEDAEAFIRSISDRNGKINQQNLLQTFGKGFGDGIDNFMDGLNNIFVQDDVMTTNQYEQAEILRQLADQGCLSIIYDTGSAMGTMTPSLVVSSVVSVIATPAAGKITGTTLLGLSNFGNSKNKALMQGHSTVESVLYAGLSSFSSATLTYFLGKIPGLSKTSGFTVHNILAGGAQKFTATWVDAGIRCATLGEVIDWYSLTEDALESFIVGACVTALTNGANATLHFLIDDQRVDVKVKDVLNYIDQHKDIKLKDAVVGSLPTFIRESIESIGFGTSDTQLARASYDAFDEYFHI